MIPVTRKRMVWFAGTALVGTTAAYVIVNSQSGGAAASAPPSVQASRGPVVLSVSGVGRIIAASQSSVQVPASSSAGSAGGAGAGQASAATVIGGAVAPGAVFPKASGSLVRFLVAPGRHVVAGQALATLGDRGSAKAAVAQAESDLASARLELQQKQRSDPLRGTPPTRPELAAGTLAVTAARAKLAKLLGPPPLADISVARSDLRRAEAELSVLRGGPAAAHAQALGIGRRNAQLAQERLNKVLAPVSPSDVATAQSDVKKAEADLAALQKAPPVPLPAVLTAAQQAVTAAQLRFDAATATGSVTDQGTALSDLDKARADLATLRQTPPAPAPEAIASLQQSVDAARLKLAKVQEPPNPADVTSARLDLDRANGELKTLETGPSPAARAAAVQSVTAARTKLARLLGPPSAADVSAAKFDLGRSEADLTVLRARGGPGTPTDIRIAQVKADGAQARLAAAHATQRLLTVRSPSAGTVTALLTAKGAPVDPSTPVLTVTDLRHLAVDADLSEFDVAQVRSGLPAIARVDALGGKSFRGRVAFVSLTGRDTGGVVTFPTRVEITRGLGLKPGMTASVKIIVAQRRNAVHVPLEAVTQDDQGRSVVTLLSADGHRSSRRISLGLANNKIVEVTKGLRAGESVVLPIGGGGG